MRGFVPFRQPRPLLHAYSRQRFLEIRKGRLVEIDSPDSFFEEG